MTLAFDPQCAPAPTDDPSDLDLVDLADEAYERAWAHFFHGQPGVVVHLAMVDLMADFIGADLTRFAQFKRHLAERTPAVGQNGLF